MKETFIFDMNKIYDVEEYWGDLVPIMVGEETGEMLQQISKFERYLSKSEEDLDEEDRLRTSLEEEIGDVMIIMMALCSRYGLDYEEIRQRIESKLNKKY